MSYHVPVLLHEVLDALQPVEGAVMVDGTLGGGGHSNALLSQGATVWGIDRDQDALHAATIRLGNNPHFHTITGNFHDMRGLLTAHGVGLVDGILLDLGVSSHQLDTQERGFSYHQNAPLDMRMDQTQPLTAAVLVNTFSEIELSRILKDWGEEPWAARIAQVIIEHRPLLTTDDLVRAVDAAIPRKVRDKMPGHSAQRTFQAIRIAVNDELQPLANALVDAIHNLKTGGRLAVITFHSLEDRIVKQTFRRLERPCTCPPRVPICICGLAPEVRLPFRHARVGTAAEIAENPRARSAKLRVAERL